MSTTAGPAPLAHLDITMADGVSEAQARAIWHAVAEARAGRFDALAAHAELVAAGYTSLEADTLVVRRRQLVPSPLARKGTRLTSAVTGGRGIFCLPLTTSRGDARAAGQTPSYGIGYGLNELAPVGHHPRPGPDQGEVKARDG